MKETLLVKHAVGGRLFIQYDKEEAAYTVEPAGEGWIFRIEAPWSDEIKELLHCKEELNVFLFKHFENEPTLKTWYYVNKGPVVYDSHSGVLTIHADSRIEYYPHLYSH